MGVYQTKTLWLSKEIISKVKRKPIGLERKFASHVFDKG